MYTLPLSSSENLDTQTALVEFFAAENLFIPFPAVMINYHGPGLFSCVHSYNRVLNDAFEDDTVNSILPREAAIDVRIEKSATTFVVFSAGQSSCNGLLNMVLSRGQSRIERDVPVDLPRFGYQLIKLSEVFPEVIPIVGATLTIQQPRQFMFYGRMLSGQQAPDGAFSANHSYYDSSGTNEYWEDSRPSTRVYPYVPSLDNRIRFYPILSPGRICVEVSPRSADGRTLYTFDAGVIESPGGKHLDFSVTEECEKAGIGHDEILSFSVIARPADGCTPTRINHQLVFSSGAIESSINMSLANPNVFTPPGKQGYSWGQLAVAEDLDSWLGITMNAPDGEACEVALTFYDDSGRVGELKLSIPPGSARVLGLDALPIKPLGSKERPTYYWYEVRSSRPDIAGYVINRHRRTGHCSGEHSF
ncbi:MAG: hypothetical protein O3C60_19945 [Planctomycetota bacterium]|nr:hypothetical protein [Planctomycetota bacterium]